jgi:hypothetical protein
MSQALHIFRKDLRRLRGWLALWIAIQAVQTVLAIVGPRLALNGMSQAIVMAQVDSLTVTVVVLTLALMVSRLIHDEPLVGLDWFWVSRPYDWRALLAAKLLMAVGFFVAVPLAGHVIVMAAFGADLSDMLRVGPDFIESDLRWALVWMVFAVLTRSLATFSLAVVGAMIAVVLLVVTITTLVIWNVTGETVPNTTGPIADASGAIVTGFVFLVATLAVIVVAYKERRASWSLLAAGVGLLAVVAVPMAWPWRFAAEWPMAFDGAGPSARVKAILDLSAPPRVDSYTWSGRPRGDRTIQVPTRLAGLPADLQIQNTFASSRLVFADGHVLQSAQSGGTIAAPETSEHPLQGLFPDSRVLPINTGAATITLAGLIQASDEELSRYGRQPGQLTSTLSYQLQRSKAVCILPLREGASYRDGSFRVDLLGVERRHARCMVVARHWRASPWWSPDGYRSYQFVLRNRQKRQAVVGDQTSPQGSASPLALPFMLIGMHGGADGQGSFSVAHSLTEFPARAEGQSNTSLLHDTWLADADLVVIEATLAGWLTRTITVDGFQMQPGAPVVESAAEPHDASAF